MVAAVHLSVVLGTFFTLCGAQVGDRVLDRVEDEQSYGKHHEDVNDFAVIVTVFVIETGGGKVKGKLLG